MTSTEDVAANLRVAERLVRRAASAGADLVALPENFAFLRREGDPIPRAAELGKGPAAWAARLAAELGIHLLAGSVAERVPRSRRVRNTSVLIGPDGAFVATYRKIHLFDVDLPGRAVLRESAVVAPGREVVVADTPLGRMGLSICYDLRFPELYRELAARGALVLFVPSAFTHFTGSHHWDVLLRARAIENQAYVVAPAQVGAHGPGRRSWGHARIVDPWGKVLDEVARGAGFALATVDLDRQEELRRRMPCLRHRRL